MELAYIAKLREIVVTVDTQSEPYMLINHLTSWRGVLLEKLVLAQLVKKFPIFCGVQMSAAASVKSI
jgi:hypothetical protein